MAETKDGVEYNLLAPQGYRTVSNVIGIQNRVLRTMTGGIRSGTIGEETLERRIKDHEIEKLSELKYELREAEKRFYDKIGCSYLEIEAKTREWYASGAKRILKNDDLIKEIREKLEEYIRTDFAKVVQTFEEVNMDKEMLLKIFKDDLEEIGAFVDDIVDGSFSAGRKASSSSKAGTIYMQMKRSKKSASGKKTFTKLEKLKGITIFESGKTDKDGNSIIEIHFTTNIPKKTRDELSKSMISILREQKKEAELTSKADINRAVGDIILKYLPEKKYPRAREKVANVIAKFLVDAQKINVENNSSVIRGMLGEVYWTAFFEYLGLKATPVGFDIQDVNGWEIPTDLLYESIGFQVKNYTVTDGVVSFNSHFDRALEQMVPESISLKNLFNNRMGLGEEAVDAFGEYFYSFEYNKHNAKIDKENRYLPIAKRFDSINRGIKSYIEANKAELLAIDRNIKLKDESILMSNPFDPGRPTFFLINDAPYPSSEIVENIIESLQKASDIVTIEVHNLSLDTSPFKTENKWPDKEEEPQIGDLMTKAKVQYKVDVKIVELFNYIILRAARR